MIKRKVLTAALVAIGIFVPLEFRAVAQTSSPTTPQDQPSTLPNSTTAPGQSSTQSNLSKADQQFMVKAAQGGMAEVQMAQLAAQNSSSDAIKDYAQRMIQDHTQANNQLMALAAQKGVTLPTTLDSKQQATYDKLSKLTGANFDKAYIKAAGINAHTQQAALFQHEAQKGQDPDVKAFAAQVLPIVQDHLQMAKSLQSGNTTGSSTTQPSSNTNMTQPSQSLPESTSSPVPSVSPSTGP
jgi:putative membrane protein